MVLGSLKSLSDWLMPPFLEVSHASIASGEQATGQLKALLHWADLLCSCNRCVRFNELTLCHALPSVPNVSRLTEDARREAQRKRRMPYLHRKCTVKEKQRSRKFDPASTQENAMQMSNQRPLQPLKKGLAKEHLYASIDLGCWLKTRTEDLIRFREAGKGDAENTIRDTLCRNSAENVISDTVRIYALILW